MFPILKGSFFEGGCPLCFFLQPIAPINSLNNILIHFPNMPKSASHQYETAWVSDSNFIDIS